MKVHHELQFDSNLCLQPPCMLITNTITYTQGRRHRGGQGGDRPLKVSKKEKKLKYGVFSCIKMSFSVIFNNEI